MTVQTFRWAAASALAGALMFPAAAAAADDLIVIPVSGFARGDEGDVVSIATVNVPAETIGATCQITGRTVNQVSVHEGNDLLIITNGQTFVVPNFEDAGFIEHEAGEITSVGATIELQIRFGPDAVSSGGFRVSVECDPSNFTTTTVQAPTTTVPDVTTTVPDVTTTEAPTTTDPSDEEPPAGPTTEPPTTESSTTTEAPDPTVPGTEATSTSVSPSTPTTEEPPAGPTTELTTSTTATPTTAPTTQPPRISEDPDLPVTGSSTGLIVGFGTILLAAGVVMRRYASAAV